MNKFITNSLPYLVFATTIVMGVFVLFFSYQYTKIGIMPEVFQQEHKCDCAPNCSSECKPYDPDKHPDDDNDNNTPPAPWAACQALAADKTQVKPGDVVKFTLTGSVGNTTNNNFTAGQYKLGTGAFQNATKLSNNTFEFSYTTPLAATPGTKYRFYGEVKHSSISPTTWKGGTQCEQELTVASYTGGCENVTITSSTANLIAGQAGQTVNFTIKGVTTDHPSKYDRGQFSTSINGGAYTALVDATPAGDGYNFNGTYTIPTTAQNWIDIQGLVHNVALGNLAGNSCLKRIPLQAPEINEDYVCKDITVSPTPARNTTISATCQAYESVLNLVNKAEFRVINTANQTVVNGPVIKNVTNGISEVYQYAIPADATTLADGTYAVQCRVCEDTTCTGWGQSSTLVTQ